MVVALPPPLFDVDVSLPQAANAISRSDTIEKTPRERAKSRFIGNPPCELVEKVIQDYRCLPRLRSATLHYKQQYHRKTILSSYKYDYFRSYILYKICE